MLLVRSLSLLWLIASSTGLGTGVSLEVTEVPSTIYSVSTAVR
jgi:hypothetical protein